MPTFTLITTPIKKPLGFADGPESASLSNLETGI
jgi:hypothetical protein